MRARPHLSLQILVHLVALGIGFILFLIASASITASLRHVDCDTVTWSRCHVTKGLEGLNWTTTILVFICLIFVLVLGIKARSGAGVSCRTLKIASNSEVFLVAVDASRHPCQRIDVASITCSRCESKLIIQHFRISFDDFCLRSCVQCFIVTELFESFFVDVISAKQESG